MARRRAVRLGQRAARAWREKAAWQRARREHEETVPGFTSINPLSEPSSLRKWKKST